MRNLDFPEPLTAERLQEIRDSLDASFSGPWKLVADLLGEVYRLKETVAALAAPYDPPDTVLTQHARNELTRAGFFQAEVDPAYQIPDTVIRLIREFSAARLPPISGEVALDAFDRLARGESLLVLTSHPSEWVDRTVEAGYQLWQNKHDPRAMSTDGGTTWFYTHTETPDRDALRDIVVGGGPGIGVVLGCRRCSWRDGFGAVDLPLLFERAALHQSECLGPS